MANRLKIKGIKVDGESIKVSKGLAELLGTSKAWTTEGKKEISGYESKSFYRKGQRITRIRDISQERKYA